MLVDLLFEISDVHNEQPRAEDQYHLLSVVVKKVKVKVNICYSAPNKLSHRRGAQVHGTH